jgi:hypothetical protein
MHGDLCTLWNSTAAWKGAVLFKAELQKRNLRKRDQQRNGKVCKSDYGMQEPRGPQPVAHCQCHFENEDAWPCNNTAAHNHHGQQEEGLEDQKKPAVDSGLLSACDTRKRNTGRKVAGALGRCAAL